MFSMQLKFRVQVPLVSPPKISQWIGIPWRSSIPHSIVTVNSVLASCAAAPMTNILWLLKAMEKQHLQFPALVAT